MKFKIVQVCPRCGGLAWEYKSQKNVGDEILANDIIYNDHRQVKAGDMPLCQNCGYRLVNNQFTQTTIEHNI